MLFVCQCPAQHRDVGQAPLFFVLLTFESCFIILQFQEGIKNGSTHETDSLLVWKWRGKAFLGAAHGSVGVLHSLLGHTDEEWQRLEGVFPQVKEVIRQTIDCLEGFRYPSGNLRTTFDGPDEDTLTEWAHGSPGYCLLLARAAEVFEEVKFVNLAIEMAEKVLWPRRMKRQGLGLTRGASGMGYVFLALSRCDRENSDVWKARAEHVAHAAFGDVNSLLPMSNRPYSLYEGLGGLVSLLMDLSATKAGSFPFFESRSEKFTAAHMPNLQRSIPASRSAVHQGPDTHRLASPNSTTPSTNTVQGKPSNSVTTPSTKNENPKSRPATQGSLHPVETRKLTPRDQTQEMKPSATTPPTKQADTRQGKQVYSTPERSSRSTVEPILLPGERLVVTPMAMRGLLSEPSPIRQKVSPAKSPGSMHYLGSEELPRNPTLLAQQLITACLQRNTAEGNLYSGGIGPWVFLQSRFTRHLMTNPAGCRIKAMKHLQSAREAAREALTDAETRKGPFHPSILTGEWVGSKCLFASVLYNSGDVPAARKHAEEVISRLESACSTNAHLECDVMYGRAGALQAVWYLRQELEDPTFGREIALSISLTILMEGLKCARAKNNGWLLLWDWRGQVFLGAANGVTGILHSILGHSEEELDLLEAHLPRFRDAIKHTIDNLHQHRHPSGNLRATLNVDEEDRHYEWAHGCTGYILLLLRASQVLNEPHYLELAKEMAVSVLWLRRAERMGVGLSRGLSGVGYVFLGLARIDLDNRLEWKERAQYYVEAAVSGWGDLLPLTNRPYSLYEGLGGLVNLILDLEDMETGHFPFFETKPMLAISLLLQENRSVQFTHVQKPSIKSIMPRPSDDAVTASTALSTKVESPHKRGRQSALPMSPLTDPHVTPAKERISSSKLTGRASSRVFPEQRKLHNHTKSDYVPSAARTTFSSRAKSRVDTPEKKPSSPSIRKLVGGFSDTH
jgi:hypothetical protein